MAEPRDPAFEELLGYLRNTRGFDFSAYKSATIGRRIEKRVQAVHVEGFEGYRDYLEVHPEEFANLFNTILINVTSFFRDPDSWQFLEENVIPKLLEDKGPNEALRIWSAGCASGEEAYSLAAIFCEKMGREQFKHRVKLYATDLDDDALQQARLATYRKEDLKDIELRYLDGYFDLNSDGTTIAFDRELRRSIIFGRHDLLSDAPISRVDLLVCRNTLMYFNSEVQEKILARFHFALREGGYLFLGKAETMLSHGTIFVPIELKHRILKKNGALGKRDRILSVTKSNGETAVQANPQNQTRFRDVMLDASPVAQILVASDGAIMLVNERARSRFGLSLKDIGRPIQDLEISYKPVELRSLIEQANMLKRPVAVRQIAWPHPSGEIAFLDIEVVPVTENTGSLFTCITFTDVTEFKRLHDDLMHFNQELETAYEELQSTNEELQTTNEELQSTVEELETTNEELHSANEELDTINGELQSTNGELKFTNLELHRLGDNLNRTNAFLESVLSCLRSAVIVVDHDMKVLAWNDRAYELWGLRSEEAEDKHLLNLDIGFPVEVLRQPIKSLLNGLDKNLEFEADCFNRRGKKILSRVTCGLLLGPVSEPAGVIVSIEELVHRKNEPA